MKQESREDKLRESEKKYYDLRSKLGYFRRELIDLKKHRGHSSAFRNLLSSIEIMEDKIKEDYMRYALLIRKADVRDEVREIQNALNRERTKREELESKIEEAKTSSGLFIKYVRGKLGV